MKWFLRRPAQQVLLEIGADLGKMARSRFDSISVNTPCLYLVTKTKWNMKWKKQCLRVEFHLTKAQTKYK